MSRTAVDRIAPPVYGAIDLIVILAPALAVKLAADRGGMGDTAGIDLVIASAVLGAGHAVLAWSRLRSEERTAARRADMWIAAADALVVLTLSATLLPVVVLWRFADESASIANRGYPIVALWAAVQLVAIATAEATGRLVFWWLEPHPRLPRSRSQSRTTAGGKKLPRIEHDTRVDNEPCGPPRMSPTATEPGPDDRL